MSARNLPGPAVLRKVARWCTSLAWSALILAEAPAGVYLTSYSFNSSQPPLVYTDEVMPACYKLRVKILGVPGYGNGFHAATSFNNDWVALQALPNAGTYTAELYWLKYDTGCTNLQEIGPFSAVTISIWPPDTTAPTVPASLVASNFATNSLTIGWTASFDAFGVTGYEVFRNATSLGTVATTSMTVSGLTAGTAYSFTVRARDAAGNWSAQSASLAAATIIDTTPPSQPTNLASSNVTPVSAVVSWNASTDNTGVSGYEVFRNGSSLGRVAGTTYTFTALSPSTGYQFQVRAFDGAGNASTTSSALEVTTLAPDTTIPTVPTNLAIAEIDATSVRLTWNPSTDDVGVTGYEVFSNGNSAGIVTGTTMTVGSLSQLTVYAFTVRAKDASNNWSAQCSPVSGRTWQRVYSSSGTIWNGEEWDEQTQQYTYNPSSDWHNFPLASSGSVRAFTTGTTDTRGDLEGSTASSGGEGGNFLIATTKSAGSRSLLVEGEYEQTQGDYGVAVDFRGANATPSASFVATPLTGRAPLVVALDGSASSDPDGQIASHAWDFDNNGTTDATGVTTVATFSNNTTSPQTFTTKLIVTDLDGGTANATRTITVYPASSYAVSVNNGTSSVPFQQAGSTVSLVAAAPPAGLQFGQWVLVSGSGTFASSTASSTTFTVGSADTVVRAVFLADTTPPSTPSAVTLTNFTADSMSVSWTVATDNVGVTAYEIYRNGVLAGTSTGTSTTIGQLASSTVYQISVRARDAAGNRSAHSQMATGKTWVRLYSAAGTIYNGWSYDEETNTWSYNPTEDSHPFVVPVAGSIKAYTRGTTDTCGYSTWTSDVCSGGDYGNFLITATASPCYAMVYVRGQYESTEGAYTVFVDLKPDANTAPTALFSAAPASGRAPLLVSFDGAPAYDLDGAIAGYAWDFDDNGSTDATGLRASTTFANTGSSPITPTVKLTVTDLDGATGFTAQTITVYPATYFGIQVDGGTASAPFQAAAASVNLVAGAPPTGLQFGSWSIVSGAGSFGNANAASTTFTLGSADTVVKANYVTDATSPSAPTGLAHSSIFADSFTVSWPSATDNVGVTAYEVFLNGSLHSVIGATGITLNGLTPWTTYQVSVKARDAAGNTSASSAPLAVRTWQRLLAAWGSITNGWAYDEETQQWSYNPSSDWHDFTVPSSGTVKGFARGGTDTFGEMAGQSSGTGGEGANFLIAAAMTAGNYQARVSGQYESTEGDYDFFVDFYPGASNILADFAATPVVGRAPLGVSFDGGASSDNGGAITSYTWDFEDNASPDATGRTTSTVYGNSGSSVLSYTARLSVSGTSGSASTTRTITVHPASSFAIAVVNGTASQPFQQSGSAVTLTAVAPPGGGSFQGWTLLSGAGSFANPSATPTTFTMGSSDSVVRAVYGADTTAPTAPPNLNYSALTAMTVTLVWGPASDNVGVTNYLVFRGTTQVGTTAGLVFLDTGLSPNTAYSYTVKAADAAGNLSTASSTLNVTTTQDFTADSDQDGIPNAIESALGSNPNAAGAADTSNQTQLNVHRPPR